MVPFVSADGKVFCVFFVMKKAFGKSSSVTGLVTLFHEPRNGPAMFYIYNDTGNANRETWKTISLTFSERWHLIHPGLRCYVWQDNLKAHLQNDVLLQIFELGVMALFLHPNTTHLFQPLDQHPFALLKRFLAAEKRASYLRQVLGGNGKGWGTDGAAQCAIQAIEHALSSSAIVASFKECGLVPFDQNHIMDLIKENVGVIEVPTVSTEAHAIIQEFTKTLAQPEPLEEVVSLVEKEHAYTATTLLAAAAEKKREDGEAFELAVNVKRIKTAGQAACKRRAHKSSDGLPLPGDDFWSDHCSSLHRKNSKPFKICGGCGLVLLCSWCAEHESALGLFRDHAFCCES